ncbi:Peptidylprolyl isomerase [Quillaja saponaria]|uniref:Rotamase n=1 Tax=Quillaja saponaria TaxID=32244 RepID=A0AAD7PCU7_QUISA|nr:Peptidylprolyl isomerase [Quillaja saponaria]
MAMISHALSLSTLYTYKSHQALLPQGNNNFYDQKSRRSYFNYNMKNLRAGKKSDRVLQCTARTRDPTQDMFSKGSGNFPEFYDNEIFWPGSKNIILDSGEKIAYMDIIPGTSIKIVEKGDQVCFKYNPYDMSCNPRDIEGPFKARLGKGEYGQGFDEGIRGMKNQGTRRIVIPSYLCPPSKSNWLANFIKDKENYKIYDLVLLDIWH